MRNQLDIFKTIDHVFVSDNTLDVMLEFERVLDHMDMYAYENWIKGELIEGPIVTRYWVECTFMWPLKLMPNPSAALRLTNRKCKVYFTRDLYIEPMIVTPDQSNLMVDPLTKQTRAKMKKTPVWVVTIKIPRRLVDGDSFVDRMAVNSNIDTDLINQAYDQNLDTAISTGVTDEP